MSKRWLFYLFSILLLGLTMEILLWVLFILFPVVQYQLSPPWGRNWVPDPNLGHRLSPFHPDHDSRGFRNAYTMNSTEVLAIGDSSTYGYGATADESWPAQLAQITSKTVYNAGVGGYGFCEYKNVLEELMFLKPKTVIIGLYLGNDLSDTFRSIYIEDRCKDLKSNNDTILKEIEKEDQIATLPELAKNLGEPSERPATSTNKTPRTYLAEYSSIYRLGRSINYYLEANWRHPFWAIEGDSFGSRSLRQQVMPFDKVLQFRTVFRNPSLYLLASNLKDVRIREGFRIIKSVIVAINKKLDNENANLVVVILHNKPYVYADLIHKNQPDFSSRFFDLVTMEKIFTSQFKEFFEENNIFFVDTLSAVRYNFTKNIPPFRESDDHHPNSNGYKTIAQEISKIW